MVTPACYTSSETSRRYSRACPPYPLGYLDRRYPHHHHLPSHHDTRLAKTMVERDMDDAPRKRIAVACGRCRKRKIRCSGDPGNGGPCSNCKNAGHEPCLFLRVCTSNFTSTFYLSLRFPSTETHLRDGSADYGYNVETARAYHARSSGGSLSPLAAFNAVAAMADGGVAGAAYRQTSYPGYATAGGKGYYSTAAWTGGTYPDDGGVAEYGLGGYPTYPTTAAQLGQDPAEQLYRYGSSASSKAAAAAAAAGSVYVDPVDAAAASTYPYGTVSSSELPNFSLSSMAASLPSSQNSNGSSASDRLPNPHRTLSSSSSVSAYRAADGLPASSGSPYSSKTSTSTGDVSTYGGDFGDSPASYSTGTSSSATLSGRSMSTQYSTAATAAAEYGAADHAGGSYIYTDNKVSTGSPLTSPSRRGSHAAAALANGHDYVPVSHSHVPQTHPSYGGGSSHDHYDVHHHHHHHSHRSQHHQHQHQHPQEYDEGATTAGTGSGATSDGHSGRLHLRR
ncbi:hypothetical protein PG993_012655 [Apiospora rasikravindrae]|uniref:Zn(2)-C6 fungal-type domain-containing protein n=1 Tax=Apiospora rasikravindrae TaxID=990691 RepID=A0ABR1S5B5_9PEZI